MPPKNRRDPKIYDPETGRAFRLGSLIERLGMMALAEKYHVSESTIDKWRRGIHRPSRKTLKKLTKQLL